MIAIRPISELRNKYTEIEDAVKNGDPVFLTKNGYGTMVVMSLDTYESMKSNTEQALDEADQYAESTSERLSHEDVFGKLRRQING